MPYFLIERAFPGAGALGQADLRAIAQRSNEVIAGISGGITWCQSLVTPGRLYCLYEAEREALIRLHALRGGFPADRIDEVLRVVGPETARGGEASGHPGYGSAVYVPTHLRQDRR